MGIAALMLCGTVNATSWRVCSKPEAGANFLSVHDAVPSNSVFAGDTLYIEPGHIENWDNYGYITKRLIIIGPGFLLTQNNISTINPEEAIFTGSNMTISANGTYIYGCKFLNTLAINANEIVVGNCMFTSGLTIGSVSGVIIRNCFFNNANIDVYESYANSCTIENNIVFGKIVKRTVGFGSYAYGYWNNCVFKNNTVVSNATNYIFHSMKNCEIYNNIVINTSDEYSTTTNSNQTVDTTWYRNYTMYAFPSNGNNVYNNILSSASIPGYANCIFNKRVDEILIWNDANTIEEKYKHIANGLAVGAGVNGTTCGAYGAVNGGRAYQPAGIPQYRPYIYDANIDETTSSNNTINASFKIKVQQ